MRVLSTSEWRGQSQLLDERARLRSLFEELRDAATSCRDDEPHDVTDDEAAIRADVIEACLAAIDGALDRIKAGGRLRAVRSVRGSHRRGATRRPPCQPRLPGMCKIVRRPMKKHPSGDQPILRSRDAYG